MTKILLILWQLPQWLAGLFWRLVTHTETKADYRGVTVRYIRRGGSSYGVSLVDIFLTEDWLSRPADRRWMTISHEWGHTRQSLYLGPLYLIVIGIPSFLWANVIYPVWGHRHHTYYWFFTESWADRLGGVKR